MPPLLRVGEVVWVAGAAGAGETFGAPEASDPGELVAALIAGAINNGT
jgi:hypothetical protein